MQIRWKKTDSPETVASGSSVAAAQRQCDSAAVDFTGFLDVYAHSCASLGCTAVAIGLPYRMQDWIVWNCKDKYRQAAAGWLAG